MQIDEYEFEEEMTLTSLAELFSKLAEDVTEGQRLELRMPSLKSGVIELPLGEPVETGLEVSLRKQSVRFSITLSWAIVKPKEEDIFEEISTQRDATRHALLSLVDEYTERRVEASLYKRLKAELEEEIFTLEDNLRKMASEKRARLLEVTAREQILQQKLSYYEQEYEKGRLLELVYADQKVKLEDDINDLLMMKRQIEEGK